ncbi:MAG: hypothetical protein ACTH64_18860, partial [Providencia sp.]
IMRFDLIGSVDNTVANLASGERENEVIRNAIIKITVRQTTDVVNNLNLSFIECPYKKTE